MTPRKLAVSVLAAIACLTLATRAAHAGGGMGAGSGVTTCRLISAGASNEPQTITLTDQYAQDTIKVGSVALICDLPAVGSTAAPYTTGLPVGTSANSVTCYTVANADNAKIAATIQDPFTEVSSSTLRQAVQIGSIALLCVPAVTTAP